MRRGPATARRLFYRPGLHLALRCGHGSYRPAVILEDDGAPRVKVRYNVKGVVIDQWVPREDLVPPPWFGPRAV